MSSSAKAQPSGRPAPRRYGFSSPLHHETVAAALGIALGVAFTTCFATGLLSHVAQDPQGWFVWPSRPAGLYRFTQGLHVAAGLATIPILLAKLWTVYPKLFEWPPFTSVAAALERLSLLPLIGGGLFLLFTGFANINLWYPWPFEFRSSHYWVAWITIGALVIHVGAKANTTRRTLRKTPMAPPVDTSETTSAGSPSRRGFLAMVAGASGLVTLLTVGQTVRPLRKLALLAPRRVDSGPQGFPVNRSALAAGVTDSARAPDFVLEVTGNVANPLRLTLDELRGLPQHEATLPIACVEGWSASRKWRGVPVRDLLEMAGARPGSRVRVHSLQQRRLYRSSDLNTRQAYDGDTLLALEVDGATLHIDHGYPVRLIGPNRPGVLQTKWVKRLVVS